MGKYRALGNFMHGMGGTKIVASQGDLVELDDASAADLVAKGLLEADSGKAGDEDVKRPEANVITGKPPVEGELPPADDSEDEESDDKHGKKKNGKKHR